MEDFQKLKVWQKSCDLSLEIHKKTEGFSWKERFLLDQIRRSAYSIPSNIAEGCGKQGKKDQARYFQISFGSACEVEHHLIYLRRAELFSDEESIYLVRQIVEIKKMLSGLINFKRRS